MKAKWVFPALVLLFLLASCTPFQPPPPTVNDWELGDAPHPSFPTLLASNGARTQDITQFWLGDTQEPSATTETEAKVVDADELDDGLESSINLGGTFVLRFRLVKSASAPTGIVYFNVLADLNGDGQWSGQNEWVVANQQVSLASGGSELIEARYVYPFRDVWVRAALTDTPVPVAQFPDGWDGTGLFKRGEIEDYLIGLISEETPTPEADWGVYCDPDPLVISHNQSGVIDLLLTPGSIGAPDTFSVGSPIGLDNDTDASEISVTQNPAPDPASGESDYPGTIRVLTTEDPPARSERYDEPVFFTDAGEFAGFITCSVEVVHTEPEATPRPFPTPTPAKYILADISVTHEIREGKVHLMVHVQNQAYDGQIYGKEIFFDGVLVERFEYDFWILPHCQPSEVDIPYEGDPPQKIEIHFLGQDGSNLGSVFSQPVTTGMGKSVPGAGLPPPRHGCE